METPWILREQQQRVVTLTLHRPDARNALSTACLEQLVYQLEQADSDADVGAVVIAGAARFFAAGADLRELQQQDVAATPARSPPFAMAAVGSVQQTLAGGGQRLRARCWL